MTVRLLATSNTELERLRKLVVGTTKTETYLAYYEADGVFTSVVHAVTTCTAGGRETKVWTRTATEGVDGTTLL